MANNRLLNVAVDTKKISGLKVKLEKYPPYAIQQGLKAANEYFNDDSFKMQMYPPESDAPFKWSSDKQRMAYFASDGFGRGIPTVRTYELMASGVFSVNEGYMTVEYQNSAPYSKYVIDPSNQIIGHRARGWQPINRFVVLKSKDIAKVFQAAVRDAWDKLSEFMYGGGAGL